MNAIVSKGGKGETLMLYAVLSQSIFGLLQIMLVDLFRFPEESASRFRVNIVAITMVYAILYALIKTPKKFLLVYLCTGLILFLTILVFPQNQESLMSEATKLTLPLVIPSFLCIACVGNFDRMEDIFYKVSWVSFGLGVIYAYQIFSGGFVFYKYSMSFSFSLLLPTLVLYTRNNVFAKMAALFLFIEIVYLGSRSAAVVIVIYVVIESFFYKRKHLVPVAILAIVAVSYLSFISGIFENFGIESRTLMLMQSDEGLIGNMSHRDEIYHLCKAKLMQYPVLGVGLYGDRLFLNGSTSHNFIIEVLLDFGLFIGGTIIAGLIVYLFRTYKKATHENRIYFVRYFCSVMIPLMVSGSYLKDYNLGLFLGICFLLNRQKRAQKIYIDKIRKHG